MPAVGMHEVSVLTLIVFGKSEHPKFLLAFLTHSFPITCLIIFLLAVGSQPEFGTLGRLGWQDVHRSYMHHGQSTILG